MFGSNQRRLTLQFHITGKCNLRCKHCYRAEGDVEPLTFAQIRMVVEQLLQLREAYNAHYGIRKRAHINLTGGEPFFREDIDQILRCLGQYKDRLTYGVLTNGSFLDAQTVQVLKSRFCTSPILINYTSIISNIWIIKLF